MGELETPLNRGEKHFGKPGMLSLDSVLNM